MTDSEAYSEAVRIMMRWDHSALLGKVNYDKVKKAYPDDYKQMYVVLCLLLKELQDIETNRILYGGEGVKPTLKGLAT